MDQLLQLAMFIWFPVACAFSLGFYLILDILEADKILKVLVVLMFPVVCVGTIFDFLSFTNFSLFNYALVCFIEYCLVSIGVYIGYKLNEVN